MATWATIRDGWGLEPLPDDLKKELCCVACHTTRGKLYCGQSLAVGVDPVAGYEKWAAARRNLVSRIRYYVFCRTCAEYYYGD